MAVTMAAFVTAVMAVGFMNIHAIAYKVRGVYVPGTVLHERVLEAPWEPMTAHEVP